jgi:putative ABC transport system permease protein
MLVSFRLAAKALLQNRLQALLTLSGMSIGVAMVVLVSGLGLGAQRQIEMQIESAGPTLISVKPGNFRPPAIVTGGQQDNSGGELSEGTLSEGELYDDWVTAENSAVVDARRRMAGARKTRNRTPAWPLSQADRKLLSRGIENVRAVAGSVAGNATLDHNRGIAIRTANVFGFEPAWPDMHNWSVGSGRLLSTSEQESGAPVMLVTASVAERLWPKRPPLEQGLNIGGHYLRNVGIIRDRASGDSAAVVPRIYVPLGFARTLLGRDDYDEIKVRSTSVASTTQVAADIRSRLRELRQLPDDTVDDFRVESQSTAAMPGMGMDPRLSRAVRGNVVEFEREAWEEMALSLRQAGRTFALLLSAAAAVSLIVGGIGVMNIMLVSVVARTREIGLRMALGARMRDVLTQFITEAVALAALGGLVGLMLGYAGLYAAANGLEWATTVSPAMFLLSIVMAAATGVVFGYGPARRAAMLDPVVALKAE